MPTHFGFAEAAVAACVRISGRKRATILGSFCHPTASGFLTRTDSANLFTKWKLTVDHSHAKRGHSRHETFIRAEAVSVSQKPCHQKCPHLLEWPPLKELILSFLRSVFFSCLSWPGRLDRDTGYSVTLLCRNEAAKCVIGCFCPKFPFIWTVVLFLGKSSCQCMSFCKISMLCYIRYKLKVLLRHSEGHCRYIFDWCSSVWKFRMLPI